MKITSHGTPVEIFGAETEEHVFSIATTAIAFETLSSKMYSDRVTAIIRELSCNAYDAHVAAGHKNKPFEVDLPTALNPEFRIRDFGTGMDDNQILELYCTYFASTKQSTNKQIGGFGIGSKSPFAYTQGFTVASIQNGEKQTYSAYINEQRVPAIVRLSSEPTSEPRGLEVKFPVKTSDFYEFIEKAAKVFEFFNPKPKLNRNDFTFASTAYTLQGTFWKLREEDDGRGIRIVQGQVPYKVASLDNIAPELKNILELNLDIFVPIGTLSPAANRETLTNEIKTVDRLSKLLESVKKEIQTNLETETAKYATGWEKVQFLANFSRLPALREFASEVIKTIIHNSGNLFGAESISPSAFPHIKVLKFGGNYDNDYRTLLGEDSSSIYLTKPSENSLLNGEFVIVDTQRGGISKLHSYYNNGRRANEHVIGIFSRVAPKSLAEFKVDEHIANAQAFLNAVGGPPFKKLSEIELPKEDTVTKASDWHPKVWADNRSIESFNYLWKSLYKESSYPDDELCYYYIRTLRNKPIDFDNWGPESSNRAIKSVITYLGIKSSQVINIPTSENPPRKTAARWFNIVEAFKSKALAALMSNPTVVYSAADDLINLSIPTDAKDPLLIEALEIKKKVQPPQTYQEIANVNRDLQSTSALKMDSYITYNTTRAVEVTKLIEQKYPMLMASREDLAKFYIDAIDASTSTI